MCGICGIRRFGKEPITVEQIKAMLMQLESRGNDATGVAVQTGDQIHVLKKDAPAWSFVASKDFESFIEEHLTPETHQIIGHTRWATQGDPAKLINNHPLYAGNCAVVHNGTINNDDSLFREMKLKRECETDSDIIRAIADAEGISKKTIRQLETMRGSCAAAIISAQDPEHLLLLRSGSPLVIASTPEQLMWASTKEALHLASRKYIKRFGLWQQYNRSDLVFATVHPDTALLFGPQGLEWHQQFRSLYYNYVKPAYDIHNVDRRVGRKARMSRSSSYTSTSTVVQSQIPIIAAAAAQEAETANDDTEESPVVRYAQCPKCYVWLDLLTCMQVEFRNLVCPDCGSGLDETTQSSEIVSGEDDDASSFPYGLPC